MTRTKSLLQILLILSVLLIGKILYQKPTKVITIVSIPFFSKMFNTQLKMKCSHWRSFYSVNSKVKHSIESNSSLPKIIPQERVGLCINFNFDPDGDGNTLRSLMLYYTLIHRYIIILTPSPLSGLSKANQALLHQYHVVALGSIPSQTNQHIRLNATRQSAGTLFHIPCIGTERGFYQHVCMSLCAQFFQQQEIPSIRGLLYIPDDLFLNFTMILMNPNYYHLDEFWMSPATALVDATNGKQQPSGWYWWHVNDNWNRLHAIFFAQKVYSDLLTTIYGPDRLLVSALADILYIPTADNQMKVFINVTDYMMTRFPSVFCEIILPIIVDVTGALCGHWPYQHDRTIFHSTVNRLNNLTNVRKLEKQHRVVGPLNAFNVSQYSQRPCLFNFNGSLWDANRKSETLYRHMLFTGQSPFVNKTDDSQIDYIHPMKLSTTTSWQHQLWHEAMKIQINRLHDLQRECS